MTSRRLLTVADDLGPALIADIAAGDDVEIGLGLAREVAARCAAARRVIGGGQPVYGVSTGMGALSGVRLTEPEQREHQHNLLLARAAGGPPWLPAPDVRALLAVRLRTFLSGDAGVSVQLCQRLADFLAAGIEPAVPRDPAGSAGEIIQLAHAFGPLTGIGRVLGPGGGTERAADALSRHGLPPLELGPKEGIALLAGVPGATALSLLGRAEAAVLAAMMEATAALSIAAIGAPADPYDAACARGDEVLGAVLRRLRAGLGPAAETGAGSAAPGSATAGSATAGSATGESATAGSAAPRMLQAPVSFRVAGPVLAQVARAERRLAGAVERALAGVTDSPAFLDGRFLGTAGFDGTDLAAHCDQLTAAVAHAAEVSAARTHRLLDPRVTGLPAQLAPRPGPDTGLVSVHKRAVGEVHALRRLAVPAALGTIETSNGQEDVQSFAWAAALALREAVRRARLVTCCELLTAYQAATLAGRPRRGGARELMERLATLIPPITADRLFGEDVERLASGSWLAAG